MTSKHLVDIELLPGLAAGVRAELTQEMLPRFRKEFNDSIKTSYSGAPPPVTVNEIWIPGCDNDSIRVLAYRPQGNEEPLPAILHIHGGGYIIGTPEMMDEVNKSHSADLQCAVFSVDYRLAPETPFPGGVEDCYTTLKWLFTNAADLRIDPARIGIKGESAGGGLGAALALLARDRGEVSPAFQHLIYPMLDDRTCVTPTQHPFAGEFIWTPTQNAFGWSCLLGTMPGGEEISPYAAPARAFDLAGLPATYMAVGALDLFLEEDLDFVRRLARAGVPVELHVYPGAFHGFNGTPTARVSIAAERDSRAALRRALHG